MSQFRALLFVFVIGVLGATTSRADSVIGNFNLDPSLNPNASQGSVRFTLQANGTIQGDLFINGPASIVGFGFNSLIANLPEYGFSPAAPDNLFGWASSFGSNPSGFYCPACTVQEEWTIGNPGDYV